MSHCRRTDSPARWAHLGVLSCLLLLTAAPRSAQARARRAAAHVAVLAPTADRASRRDRRRLYRALRRWSRIHRARFSSRTFQRWRRKLRCRSDGACWPKLARKLKAQTLATFHAKRRSDGRRVIAVQVHDATGKLVSGREIAADRPRFRHVLAALPVLLRGSVQPATAPRRDPVAAAQRPGPAEPAVARRRETVDRAAPLSPSRTVTPSRTSARADVGAEAAVTEGRSTSIDAGGPPATTLRKRRRKRSSVGLWVVPRVGVVLFTGNQPSVGPLAGMDLRYGLPFGGRWLHRKLQVYVGVSYFRQSRATDTFLRAPAMPPGAATVRSIHHTVAADLGLGYLLPLGSRVRFLFTVAASLVWTTSSFAAYSEQKEDTSLYPGGVAGGGVRLKVGPGAIFLDVHYRFAAADLGPLGDQVIESQSGVAFSMGYDLAL